MFDYGFTFQYREVKNGEVFHDRLFIKSNDKDMENACTVAMLQFLTKHNYYSGKLLSCVNLNDKK